jgi:hypothetical protein
LVEKWDDYQEVEIQEKIGNVDNLTTLEKGHIMNHIIFKYMRLKSVKFNIKSYDKVYNTLLKIINDPEFREFTFNRYHVFIYQDVTGKSICISKISNEILTFIHNRGNLSDDELLIRVKELIRKSKFLQAKLSAYVNRDKRMDKA